MATDSKNSTKAPRALLTRTVVKRTPAGRYAAAVLLTVAAQVEAQLATLDSAAPLGALSGDRLRGVALTGPVWVSLQGEGAAVSQAELAASVGRELGLSLAASPELAGARVDVRVQLNTVTVVIERANGPAWQRSVVAPARADEVPETAALLVGNLARDESSALLATLVSVPVPVATPSAITDQGVTAPKAPALPLRPFNLSLFYPIATAPDDRQIVLELGLFYGRIGALSGLAATPAVTQVRGPALGLQAAGLGNLNSAEGAGLRAGGVFNASGGNYHGVSAAGVADFSLGGIEGLQAAGTLARTGGNTTGLQVGGVAALAGDVDGAQIAGTFTLAERVHGLQAAGTLAMADAVQGVQFSLVNIGGPISGAQIGLVNIADRVDGMQLGFVNVADEVHGASVGMVTYSRAGGVQAVSWYDSTSPFNAGVRFVSGVMYGMPTFTYDPFENEPTASTGLSLGVRMPWQRFFFDIEGNASETHKARGTLSNVSINLEGDETLDLRYRALAGVQLTPWAGVFVGGGVLHHLRFARPRETTVEPLFSAGLQLF
jgi:hypothetical protein